MNIEEKEIVDEFKKLQDMKKDIEVKLQTLKDNIIKLAIENNTDKLLGTKFLCSVKEYEKVVYPDNKSELIEMIKSKGIYEQFSSINYLKLGPKIVGGEVDKEIVDLVNKEKAFRLSLKKRTL